MCTINALIKVVSVCKKDFNTPQIHVYEISVVVLHMYASWRILNYNYKHNFINEH